MLDYVVIYRMFGWRTNAELIELEATEEIPHCSDCKHTGQSSSQNCLCQTSRANENIVMDSNVMWYI